MKFKHYIYIFCCIIFIGLFFFCIYAWRNGWEKMSQMDCQCNIKQILISLYAYAEKNDGWFPDKDGAKGIQMLYDQNYFNENSNFVTSCPSVSSGKKSIDYDYIAGYKIDSDKNIGIVFDREANHKNYGNIGFVDGRTLPFSGKDWRKNANKKSE